MATVTAACDDGTEHVPVFMSVRNMAIVIPSAPGLVYWIECRPTHAHIRSNHTSESLGMYATEAEAARAFMSVVRTVEGQRRAAVAAATLQLAINTPLDSDADVGL